MQALATALNVPLDAPQVQVQGDSVQQLRFAIGQGQVRARNMRVKLHATPGRLLSSAHLAPT